MTTIDDVVTGADEAEWTCHLCPAKVRGIAGADEHLRVAHPDITGGEGFARWPDGGLAVDASDVPELVAEDY